MFGSSIIFGPIQGAKLSLNYTHKRFTLRFSVEAYMAFVGWSFNRSKVISCHGGWQKTLAKQTLLRLIPREMTFSWSDNLSDICSTNFYYTWQFMIIYVTSYVAVHLTFDMPSCQTSFLAFSLTFQLAFYLMCCLAFYLTLYLAFHVAFYLAFYLTLYLPLYMMFYSPPARWGSLLAGQAHSLAFFLRHLYTASLSQTECQNIEQQ